MAVDKQAMKDRFRDGFSVMKEKAAVFADDAMDKTKVGMEKAIVVAKESGEKFNDARIELDRKVFSPLDADMILANDFSAPRLVRLLDSNPYAAKEACRDAAGFNSVIAKNRVLQLVKGEYPEVKFQFIPNLSEEIYLRNPYVEDMYISLNSYFDYIKNARVAELETVANKLGAKYVKISYKETEKKFVSVKGKKKEENSLTLGKEKGKGSDQTAMDFSQDSLKEIEVASESNFVGHSNPSRPELVYFKGAMEIESLIEACLGDNRPTRKSYTMKYNRSSDLNLDAAVGIDAVLGKLKMSASASVKSEVERENRMYLTFDIEF